MLRSRRFFAFLVLLLLVLVLPIFLSGPSTVLAGSPARLTQSTKPLDPDPVIQGIIDQVTQTDFYDFDAGLAGEHPVTIGGQSVTLSSRYTASPKGILSEQYMYEYFQSLGYTPSYQSWNYCGTSARNIIAEKPGAVDPSRIYIISGHLDDTSPNPQTYAPGADDNGSGTTAVAMAARILAPYTFDYTIRFVAFTGEEQYLCGSHEYARVARSLNENIQGVVNLDMIAYDGDGIKNVDIAAGTRADSLVVANTLIANISTYGLNLIPTLHTAGSESGSDHASFWTYNYPAILGIESEADFNTCYHSRTCPDVMSNTDMDMAQDFTKAGLATMAELAGVHPLGTATPTPTGTLPTATPTRTPTFTPSPTPTTCTNYGYATATATIVPGDTDTGNHCDDCVTSVSLPFPVRFYGSTFNSVNLSSNGNLQFSSSNNEYSGACPPDSMTYAALLLFDDLKTDTGTGCSSYSGGCGIFTSVSGSAPNRVFNIEWRAIFYSSSAAVNFEARIPEDAPSGSPVDFVYGTGATGTQQVGVYQDANVFVCYPGQLSSGMLLHWVMPPCGTVTPVVSFTPTPTEEATLTTIPTNTYTPEPTFTFTPSPTATECPCAITFTDVFPTDYFYEAVSYLYLHGAITGYSDNTFRPYNMITRGQISKVIVLAEGWTVQNPPTPTFSDVPIDNPFYGYIETAYAHQIISGYADGTFRPGMDVTRGQVSKIVVLAEEWTLQNPQTPTFSDVLADNPFYTYVETAYSHHIISGYADGTFRPFGTATRGQISKVIYLAVTAP